MGHLVAGSVKLLLLAVVVAFSVVFTIRASGGDGIPKKIAKFLGILVSTVPVIGLLQYLAFRASAAPYSLSCGHQALVGVLWYVGVQAASRVA